MKTIVKIWALAVMATLFIPGCKEGQKAIDGKGTLVNKRLAEVLANIEKRESNLPHYISFKSATEIIEGEKTTSFKASVRMVPDSVIWISISAYKYEVARILATPDSLKFFIRTEKKYYRGDYEYIAKKLNVDFSFDDIQALLLGHSIGLNEIEKIRLRTSKKEYILSSIGNKHKLKKLAENPEAVKVDPGKGELLFSNWINPDDFSVFRALIVDLQDSKRVLIENNDFENFDGLYLPTSIKMDIIAEKETVIKSQYSKIHVDRELKFPYKVSEKYEPLEEI